MTIRGDLGRAALLILGVIAAGLGVAVFAPLAVPGYDATYTLAWGRDLTHGLALDFSHTSSPTPHPLAILGGLVLGFVPVPAAMHLALGFTVAMAITVAVLLAFITRQLTGSSVAVAAAVVCLAASAAVWLLVMNSASDITYLALGLAAVFLTLRSRRVAAINVFMVAALLRPEAALLALVPLLQVINLTQHHADDAGGRRRAGWTFGIGVTAAAGLWLVIGALGGSPLIGLSSASSNANTNDNPHGLHAAVTTLLPGLAGVAGWVTVSAAAVALVGTMLARRRTARISVTDADSANATLTVGAFIGIAMVAYLAQGLLSTPLVARYLLLPAVLLIAVAARCVTLAGKFARAPRAQQVVQALVALGLVAGSVVANNGPWHDVTAAHQVRTEAFAASSEVLDSDLVRDCDAPFVVRSPAIVALTALKLDRSLSQIVIADEPGAGVLLQPLTVDAAQLAGYGPITPLQQQAVFPQTAPPRESNDSWALYSSCQP